MPQLANTPEDYGLARYLTHPMNMDMYRRQFKTVSRALRTIGFKYGTVPRAGRRHKAGSATYFVTASDGMPELLVASTTEHTDTEAQTPGGLHFSVEALAACVTANILWSEESHRADARVAANPGSEKLMECLLPCGGDLNGMELPTESRVLMDLWDEDQVLLEFRDRYLNASDELKEGPDRAMIQYLNPLKYLNGDTTEARYMLLYMPVTIDPEARGTHVVLDIIRMMAETMATRADPQRRGYASISVPEDFRLHVPDSKLLKKLKQTELWRKYHDDEDDDECSEGDNTGDLDIDAEDEDDEYDSNDYGRRNYNSSGYSSYSDAGGDSDCYMSDSDAEHDLFGTPSESPALAQSRAPSLIHSDFHHPPPATIEVVVAKALEVLEKEDPTREELRTVLLHLTRSVQKSLSAGP